MANKTKASEVSGKSKDELEVEDRSKGSEESTEAKLINLDNGTQTFEDSKTEKVTAPVVVEGAAKMDNVEAEVNVDWIETPVVVREKRIIDPRITKSGYDALIEKYKATNPKKYEAKKAELERKANEAK